MGQGLDLGQVKALVEAGAVKDLWIAGSSKGWGVSVNGQWLLTQRGSQRLFKKLETCLGMLRELGLGKGRISWDQWSPEQLSL